MEANDDAASTVTAAISATWKLVQAEAVRLCGDEDGVVEGPLSCHFRPEKIRCKSAGGSVCLMDSQIATLRRCMADPEIPHGPKGRVIRPAARARWIIGATPGEQQGLIYGSNFFPLFRFADPNYDT